jgi:hypothetical protein
MKSVMQPPPGGGGTVGGILGLMQPATQSTCYALNSTFGNGLVAGDNMH